MPKGLTTTAGPRAEGSIQISRIVIKANTTTPAYPIRPTTFYATTATPARIAMIATELHWRV
jgi:hypothetical protein